MSIFAFSFCVVQGLFIHIFHIFIENPFFSRYLIFLRDAIVVGSYIMYTIDF